MPVLPRAESLLENHPFEQGPFLTAQRFRRYGDFTVLLLSDMNFKLKRGMLNIELEP